MYLCTYGHTSSKSTLDAIPYNTHRKVYIPEQGVENEIAPKNENTHFFNRDTFHAKSQLHRSIKKCMCMRTMHVTHVFFLGVFDLAFSGVVCLDLRGHLRSHCPGM